MSTMTTQDQLRDLSRLFKLEADGEYYSVEMRDANYIVLLARTAAREIDDLQKKAAALEHWRQEVGKLHSKVARLEDQLEELRPMPIPFEGGAA
ncbi:hypothetical protein NL154_05500 [Rhizobium sp. YTUHZ044]|uniref:hypothetical protein n=1 Tax=Rhizobium sp. YTUHZ044 TaxID=2962678 RepID=UPI003DA95019